MPGHLVFKVKVRFKKLSPNPNPILRHIIMKERKERLKHDTEHGTFACSILSTALGSKTLSILESTDYHACEITHLLCQNRISASSGIF